MSDFRDAVDELHVRLGYRRPNLIWAKLEILLGLTAAGIGLILAPWIYSRSDNSIELLLAAEALVLFVLGSYLALAGHRSHLYRSMNDHAAFLAEKFRHTIGKGQFS
jgi:hypothetical protein